MRFDLEKKHIKRISSDMIINLVGTGIGLVVLQLVIYPIIAKTMGAEAYGQMQSIVSVVYLLSGTLGSTLCTTRLVRHYEYAENAVDADFNYLACAGALCVLVFMPIILPLYVKGIGVLHILLITLLALLNYTSNYCMVGFRLKINYRAIFVVKLLGCVGYLIGFGLFRITQLWEFVFIASFFLETLYCLLKTDLLRENYERSVLLKQTWHTFVNLGTASLLSRTLTYFDKFLLYPLMGGEAVSIYYTANVFGKLILMAIEPITNVILSYLSKEKGVSRKVWRITVPIALSACLLMYIVCLLVSEPILRFFYPQWADKSIPLVPLCTLCLAISAFLGILRPLTLKALDSRKQILFNAASVLTYIAAVFLLYRRFGIQGCCLALLLSYIVKLILIVFSCIRQGNGT